MDSQKYLRKGREFGWCPGCGLYVLFNTLCESIEELNLKNPVLVSGIGCSARTTGYFDFDTIHSLHGRAIPIAVGIKKVNPKLKVIVVSGDGDLTGIGGNHLLHAARRNEDVTVICYNNEVFGMTGGQASPTTRIGGKTVTTPDGNPFAPLNIQGLLMSNKWAFYARCSPVYKSHMKECINRAINHKGFSFVEIRFPCIISYGKRTGKSLAEMLKEARETYKICSENKVLKDDELGFVEND